ncbi:MAG: FtsQ-type POTRA domain-containing protein, partial [Desulfobulbaceae bacterium]|nr:FtsQ-type POTRA domain-containing protein [Desulfobulbaceae bacterium]
RRRKAGGPGRKILAKMVLVVAIVSLTSSLGLFLYHALGQSSFFQIVDIEIKGCQRLSKEELLELSGVDVHSNLVEISSGQVQGLLEGHSWIERAAITRKWPDRLIISVKERKPVAIVNLDDGLHYVDRAAKIFAAVDPKADFDYPVITGLAGDEHLLAAETSGLVDALLLIKYACRPNPNLPAQNISEIRISDNDLVLFLVDRPFPIRLGRSDMWGKYKRLVKVLSLLYNRKEFSRVSYVDVDYAQDRVLVGMGAG